MAEQEQKPANQAKGAQRRAEPSTASPRPPTDQTDARQEGGLKNSLHGVAYQLKLILMVVVQASRLMQADPRFSCTISTEDPDEGKFDDIVFRYRYRGSARVLSIQAKHKAARDQTLSWQDLALNSTSAPYAIVKYFTSFVEQRESGEADSESDQRLVLCTNADLQANVKDVLQVEPTDMLKESDLCYIFKLIGASCYRFDVQRTRSGELQRIIELLRESSECYGLGKLLARTVYTGAKLDLNTKNAQRAPLLAKYRGAIVRHILGDKRAKTVHCVAEAFCDGTLPAPGGTNLRDVFEAEYVKLSGGTVVDVWGDVRAKGITLKDALKAPKDPQPNETTDTTLPQGVVTDEVIGEFFDKFRLVCGSRSEDQLSRTVMEFWKPAGPVDEREQTAAYSEMLRVVFDWMKEQKQPPTPLTKREIEGLFETIAFGSTYPELRCIGRIYREGLEFDKYRWLEVQPECVARTPLFAFLNERTGSTVYRFRSPHSRKFSPLIVWQIVHSFAAAHQERGRYEVLFVDSSIFLKSKTSIEAVLRLKNLRIVLVIVVNDGHQELLGDVAQDQWLGGSNDGRKKIVLIEWCAPDGSNDGCSLSAADLTAESREAFLGEHHTVRLFGTEILARQLVHAAGDGLATLLELGECFAALEAQPSVLEEQYRTIRRWYIQRQYVPYEAKGAWQGAARRFLDSTNFKRSDTMPFAAFFDALKRELLIKLFESWEITAAVDEYERGYTLEPPGLSDADPTNAAGAKVHIVLEEAGFGKSTYLTWLGWYLQRRHNAAWWIVRFNAIEYSTDFEQILRRTGAGGGPLRGAPMHATGALRVLFQLVHLALFVRDINRRSIAETDRERTRAERCASLLGFERGRVVLDEAGGKRLDLTALELVEVRLFAAKFNARQLVVLFDGFDEIVPYYKEVVYGLFARWQAFEGIHRVYFTSRPYELRPEFERLFGERARFYRLRRFDKKARLVAIHIFLKENFDAYRCYAGEEEVQQQRNDLLGSLEAIARCYLSELRNTPLFIRMGLEILGPLLREHVCFRTGTIRGRVLDAINARLEKLRLIETFVENKLHIASVVKVQTSDAANLTAYALDNAAELNKRTHRMHSALALFAMFNAAERELLLTERDAADALEYMEQVRHGSVKSGIVEGVVRDVPLFVHRVFVEYFAARWVYERTRFGSAGAGPGSMSDPHWFGGRDEVKEFFDRMLIRDGGSKPIHLATINRSLLEVGTLLRDQPAAAYERDAGGRTFLHLMAAYLDEAYCLRKPAEFLAVFARLDAALIDCRDTIRGWTALDYAFVFDFVSLVRQLLRADATLSVDALTNQALSLHCAEDVLQRAANYECVLLNFRFSGATQRYQEAVPRRVAQYVVRELHFEPTGGSVSEESGRGHACHRTPLGYCVERDAVGLFRSLVELAGGLRQVPVERLLRKAFLDHAVHVIQYLVVECGYPPPPNLVGMGLFWVLTRAIECHYGELFRILLARIHPRKRRRFERMFRAGRMAARLRRFRHGRAAASRDEPPPDAHYETGPHERPWNVGLERNRTEHYALQLLCTAVAADSVYALASLLRTFGVTVTNELIVTIVQAVAGRRVYHQRSERALLFLIDRTTDLHHVDWLGRTLLHTAIDTGWTVAAKYLLARGGFDTRHALLWCASRPPYQLPAWVQGARVEMFHHLMELLPADDEWLQARDVHGNTVLQAAVGSRHFAIGSCILEAAVRPVEGLEARVGTLRALLQDCRRSLTERQACDDFVDWMAKQKQADDAPTSSGDADASWQTVRQAVLAWMQEERSNRGDSFDTSSA